MGTTLITNGQLIDGTGAPPRPFAGVLIRDATIDGIYPQLPPGGVQTDATIDLGGATLLPGLWDAHAHLGMVFPQPALHKTPHHELPADRTVRCGRAAMEALDHGVTSIRVVGEADYVDVAWKRAFETGLFTGPRLFVCGRPLIATGGHGWQSGAGVEVDGPAEVRKAAREQLRRGADQIKLMITGGVASPTETMFESQMTMDEIEAAVEIAGLKGRKVAAHVGGPLGAKMAVRAGVASIEHGYHLDDEAIELMVEHGTTYVPTLAVTQDTEFVLNNNAPFAIAKIQAAAERHLASFQKALAAGVTIATGEDMPVPFAERVIPEIETMVACGMEPMAAIVASTKNAAELCDVADRLGTAEVGKVADLIAVRGDPSEDISRLNDLLLVFKAGELVVDRRES
ncbi:MAG: amidohydrolase family protein [Truepera sp.]|nr:amidohydrolase family protein [Truepera sp.]